MSRRSGNVCFNWAGAGLILLAIVCVDGCGRQAPPLPPTYPVHGKVTYRNGQPLTAGRVEFIPEAESRVVSVASIQSDGTYRLVSKREGLQQEGAVAGMNRVFIVPKGSTPITYPTPIKVEPRDNECDLVL